MRIESSYEAHVVSAAEAAYTALVGAFKSDGKRQWLNNTYPSCHYYSKDRLRYVYATVGTSGAQKHGLVVGLYQLAVGNGYNNALLDRGIQALQQSMKWEGDLDYGYGINVIISGGLNTDDVVTVWWGVERG